MSKTDRYGDERQRSLGVALVVIASVIGLVVVVAFVSIALHILTA